MNPLFFLSLLLLSLSLFSAEIKGKAVGVSDGDTITVSDSLDNGKFRIRLDKIDAPEKDFSSLKMYGVNSLRSLAAGVIRSHCSPDFPGSSFSE